LTAVGLYGVLAYHVSQRSNEFGVRSALGATSPEIIGLIVKQGLAMIGAGLILGLIGAVAGSRLIQSLLYRTDVFDPVTIVFATVFLGGVAFVGFGIEVPLSDLVVGMVFVGVVSALPIAVAGLGTGQIAVVEAFGHLASRETLLALSLVLTACLLGLRAAIGLSMAREFSREGIEELFGRGVTVH